jgi:hypothetical protein
MKSRAGDTNLIIGLKYLTKLNRIILFSSDGVALRAPSRGPSDDRAGRFAQLQTFD